jgi:hypothetical protein
MIRFDVMNLAVFAVQLLLIIPCSWVTKPLPAWLQKELHLKKPVAVGATGVVTVLLWLAIVMLIIVVPSTIKKRRHPKRPLE